MKILRCKKPRITLARHSILCDGTQIKKADILREKAEECHEECQIRSFDILREQEVGKSTENRNKNGTQTNQSQECDRPSLGAWKCSRFLREPSEFSPFPEPRVLRCWGGNPRKC